MRVVLLKEAAQVFVEPLVEPRERLQYADGLVVRRVLRAGTSQGALGDIGDCEMRLSKAGQVIAACWDEIPTHFPNAALDAFVVMPNHVHGILVLTEPKARHASPLHVIVCSFKAAVNRRVGAAL